MSPLPAQSVYENHCSVMHYVEESSLTGNLFTLCGKDGMIGVSGCNIPLEITCQECRNVLEQRTDLTGGRN